MNLKKMYQLLYFLLSAPLDYSARVVERNWATTDELENHISPDDLREFYKVNNLSEASSTTERNDIYASAAEDEDDERRHGQVVPGVVDCFGLGAMTQRLPWLFNMRPDSTDTINTHFFFYSRVQPFRAQVLLGDQFGLEWVDFNPSRKSVMIVHGFMSHSNASWVNNLANAILKWGDVNVITVDWSGGGNTWKYWRAVANTRRVGADILRFLTKLKEESGAQNKDFHFIGHSLGAHICSYVSFHLGGVARITGLDPAQPCFRTIDRSERLDDSDADFVDIIHTNGRLLKKIGFGLPEPVGHADFYPNGGMKQPGCYNESTSMWSRIFPKLQRAICSHGRAYLLFTESLINNNCSFRAYRWNLSYDGINASLTSSCDRLGSCAEMGIHAIGGNGTSRAKGPYFVLTTERVPYCPSESERQSPAKHLIKDLRDGFQMDQLGERATTRLPDYADPEARDADISTTTKRSWFWWRG